MMVLYLIRHGQSTNNVLEYEPGDRVAEPPLTPIGHAQAERVAEYVHQVADKSDRDPDGRGYGITQLFCSAMLRTLQTAAPIARSLNLNPTVWLDVHESGGIWLDENDGQGPLGLPGLGRPEIEKRFPGFILPDGIREEGWWGETQETHNQMMDRALHVAKEIQARFSDTDERVAIVSHGGFISGLVETLVQNNSHDGVKFNNHNTAINRLEISDGSLSIRYLNRVEHLPPDLIT